MNLNRLLPVAAAVIVTLAAPLAASAKGGGGGGTTTPPANDGAPCAAISLPRPSDAFNTAGKVDPLTVQLQVRITSCASGTQSYLVDVVDDAFQNLGGGDCSFAPFTVGPFTVKAGETKSFSFDTPTLPFRICTHMMTETLRATADGSTWGSAVQRLDTQQRI
ncbi:MAG: hypothetical protein U0Q03_16560 [Acidimicrobiales bacterium]